MSHDGSQVAWRASPGSLAGREVARVAVAGLSGVLFALGLGLSGMTDPRRVVGFLDVTGHWNPALALVMVGAIATYGIAFRAIVGRGKPLLAPSFQVPTSRVVDGRLLAGATLFGIGWGLAGYCPGPAIVSLATASGSVALFVGALLAGTLVGRASIRRFVT